MKKNSTLVLSIILALSICAQMFGEMAFAISPSSQYLYTVRGYSANHSENIPVTINVFKPGMSAEDLKTKDAKDVLIYHDQSITQENGFYEFEFSADTRADYEAYVKCLNEDIKKIICEEYQYPETPIFSLNFENEQIDADISGNAVRKTTDEEHGYSLACTPETNATSLAINLNQPITSGIYLLEYDANLTRTDNYSYLRFMSRQKNTWSASYLFQSIVFDSAGNLGYYDNLSGWTTTVYESYTTNKWYNIKVWFDLDKHFVYYYVDGKLMAGIPLNNNMDKIWGIQFCSERNTGGTQYLDNISLQKVSYGLTQSMDPDEIPEYIRNPIKIKHNSENVGNIFYKSNAEVKWICENAKGCPENVTVNYELIDSDNNVADTYSEQITLGTKSVSRQKVNINFAKFGLYTLRITVSNDNVYAQKNLKLSYVNTSDNKLTDLGVCTHFVQSKGTVNELMPIVDTLGVGMIRDEIYWHTVEQEKGVYKIPEANKRFISYANAHNIEVLQILNYGNSLYGGAAPWEDDSVLEGYKNYCYQVALALKGKVKYFEIWNEYDLNCSYGVDGYIRLLKAGYEGVKLANPDAFVVAIAPLDVSPFWVSGVLNAMNGERYMDALANHPYNFNIPENGDSDWGFVGKFKQIRNTMERYGYGDLPIWATEVGWPENKAPDQAAYIVRLAMLNQAHKMMDKMFFYDMQNDGVSTTNDEYNFGMIEPWQFVDVPYAAKESYLALSNYNAVLGQSTLLTYSEGEDGNYIYKYKNEDNDTVYAVWNINGVTQDIELDADEDASTVSVIDMYGNEEKKIISEGKVSVEIGTEPVYVRFNKCDIQVSSSGRIISSLSQVKAGDVIEASVNCSAFQAEKDTLYAACYKGGKLISVNGTSTKINNKLNISVSMSDQYDKIKFFLWKDDMKPRIANVELKGDML